ncbi:hypothetical protein P4O66_013838 [Electrophorus voltai]|uniref:Serglycin n=1 Tax=Electrophorus voltai TaxID=2609070 RepID=A0AAD8Z3M8_9TELE|nr:serglycin [Electrophorus electricus]KAK1791864.1 hypothetical protein P4O66_013838 [Electrophorus voltai]
MTHAGAGSLPRYRKSLHALSSVPLFRRMTMRLHGRIALALVLVCLLGDNVLGGRYHSLKCRPDGKNANCVEKKDIRVHSNKVEAVDLSGEASGDLGPMNDLTQELPETEEQSLEVESSGETSYTNEIMPQQMKPQLSEDDLKQDNMIQ